MLLPDQTTLLLAEKDGEIRAFIRHLLPAPHYNVHLSRRFRFAFAGLFGNHGSFINGASLGPYWDRLHVVPPHVAQTIPGGNLTILVFWACQNAHTLKRLAPSPERSSFRRSHSWAFMGTYPREAPPPTSNS